MAAPRKKSLQYARQLFRLSLADGAVSPEHVSAVLAYLEKNPPADRLGVLRAYRRLIAAELARGRAVVEHAGPMASSALDAIARAMSGRYQRPVTAESRPNPALLAGLRVHVGDDIYESSVSGQLTQLASSL